MKAEVQKQVPHMSQAKKDLCQPMATLKDCQNDLCEPEKNNTSPIPTDVPSLSYSKISDSNKKENKSKGPDQNWPLPPARMILSQGSRWIHKTAALPVDLFRDLSKDLSGFNPSQGVTETKGRPSSSEEPTWTIFNANLKSYNFSDKSPGLTVVRVVKDFKKEVGILSKANLKMTHQR